MKLFEIQNNFPIVTAECLMIPAFKVIWDRDKSKDKSVAYAELQYVYFSADYKSIYLSFDKNVREERLREDFLKDVKWKPDSLVLKAIDAYKQFQKTPTMRFLEANQNAMESMTEYFNSIDWNATNGKMPKYDITKVSTAVKNAGGIIDNIEKLKDKVAKEQRMSQSVARGNSTGGMLEFD